MGMATTAMLTAKDIMSSGVIVVSEDMTTAEVVDVLRRNEISGAPVTDASGKLVGVVSLADIARQDPGEAGVSYDRSSPQFFLRGWESDFNPEDFHRLHIESEGRRVAELMTPAVFTVDEETAIAEIARTMVSSHIHRVLVTRGGEVVGIVSSLDLLKTLVDED